MAYTFFKARGVPVGQSLVEDDKVETARTIEADARQRGVSFELPVDHVVTDKIQEGTANEVLSIGDARIGDRLGVDIGPATIKAFETLIADAKTVVWNGPMGVFEIEAFATGTNAVARAVAKREGNDDHRRRRFDRGGAQGRHCRPHHAHLDRRRRLARVSRRPDAARRRGAVGQVGRAFRPAGRTFKIMRIPLIAGNWKMFKTVHETIVFAKELRSVLKDVTGVEIVVAPPFTAVHAAAEALRNSNIAVAAQDLYWEREGAFTGEVSAPMIKDAGAEFVIIGHSERRRLFGETDAMVNRKVTAAIGAGLTPIVCVGETLEERERNETLAVLDRQIKDGLDGVTGAQVADLVVAYEPVWAIGTGRNATAAQAEEAHQHIRQRLRQWFGGDAAERLPRDLRRQRETGQYRAAHRANPTSTARWSAARAWRSGASPSIVTGSRQAAV